MSSASQSPDPADEPDRVDDPESVGRPAQRSQATPAGSAAQPPERQRPASRRADGESSTAHDGKPWVRFAGLGMELAGSTLVLAGIGHLIDRWRGGADGLGIAIGALVGFSFGMFRLIQLALREIKRQSKPRQ